ncbi:hypothetical protein PRABACTJOHN_03027 [Parabacteroides johnsonii DSM 18315]|uniref:Uncharacterized protein n=1 Tax=Parabacteroides johnsonii DSM 18315 TaxID=537006 RepID=B7BDA7_9BACT|nr:hypothetical protein PRABACTJOHN_03027 [Parabacteroides johnsonii DSM 18315]
MYIFDIVENIHGIVKNIFDIAENRLHLHQRANALGIIRIL